MIVLKRDVRIKFSDDIVIDIPNTVAARVKGHGLATEMPLFSLGHSYELYPGIFDSIFANDIVCFIDGSIANDDPLGRPNRLTGHGKDCLLDKQGLIPRRSDEDVRHCSSSRVMIFAWTSSKVATGISFPFKYDKNIWTVPESTTSLVCPIATIGRTKPGFARSLSTSLLNMWINCAAVNRQK